MKRRFFTLFFILTMLLTMTLPAASASETQETTGETTEETAEATEETAEETEPRFSTATSGSCGDDVTWRLEDHVLILTGSGAVDAGSPWEFYKDTIHTLILDGPITSIGDKAFFTCNNLQYVDFGDSLVEIGTQAFYSCNALEAIRLPATFRKFGPECFRDCESLQVVYCDGPMPSFKASCLYTEHTVSIYYPRTAPWPQEEVDRLRSNFGARLSISAGGPEVLEDYVTESDFPDAETLVPPETTEATVPETTVPETTVPEITVPETTVPETTLPPQTGPQTPSEETEAPVFLLESEPLYVTEPKPEGPTEPAPRQESGFQPGVWVLIAAASLTGILVLVLLIRMIFSSGGRYED